MTGKTGVVAARLEALRARHAALVEHLLGVLHPSQDADAVDATMLRVIIENQVDALDDAHDELEDLADDVRRAVALQTSLQIDWAGERKRLAELLADDPHRGTVRWFGQAVAAAVMFDVRALDELLDGELRVPDAGAVLVDRIRLLRQGLANRDWASCQELLSEVAWGRLGEQLGLSDLERAELALTLARLALWAGEHAEAGRLLERAAVLGAGEADRHLTTAWLQRAEGDRLAAKASLDAAIACGASSVEVVVEFAHQLTDPSTERVSAHLPIVEAEVWALASIDTAEIEIDRLIEPAPPAVWLSLGRRFAAGGEADRALAATARARHMTPADEGELLAQIDECDLDITRQANATPSELKDALVNAAVSRISASHLDRALDLLDEALSLVPADPAATLQRADCLRLKISDEPLSRSRPVLAEILESVAAVPFADGNADYSWGLLIRASAESLLCDGLDADAWAHAWRSVQAAATAVACRPNDAVRWGELTRSSLELGLQQVALRASAIGRQLAQGAEHQSFLREAHARALATVGRLGDAAELVADSPDRVLAVAIEAVGGKPSAAIDELLPRARTLSLESFDWQVFLLAMLATEDGRAPAVAELARDDAHGFADELSWVAIEIIAELTLGHPERAGELTAGVHEALQLRSSNAPYGAMWHGVALLLNGETDEGGRVLRNALGLVDSTVHRAVWHALERPAIERLIAINRRPVPTELLAELDTIVAARTASLATRDVDDELDLFELDGPDPAEARQVVELVRAVMRLADGDPEPIIEQTRLAWPAEGDARRAFIDDRARDGVPKLRAAQLATELAEVDVDARQRLVETIVELDYLDADVYLANAALPEPVRVDVARVLVELAAGTSELATSASFVLRYLNWPDASDPLDKAGSPWRLELPSSWFEGIEDVLDTHPLFSRAIPSVRQLRALPGINVAASDEFEPDRYAISHEDRKLEHGEAPERLRWLPSDDLSIVPGWTRLAAASPWPWVAVEPPADDDDPLGLWCTAGTYEMLVRRVAALAAPAAEAEPVNEPEPEPAPARPTTFGDVAAATFKWLMDRGRQR